MKLSILPILILALVLFLISAEAQQNNLNKKRNLNKIRRVVRRRGRQRTNRQIGQFGNRVALAPSVRFAPAPLPVQAPAVRFAPAPLPVQAPIQPHQPIQVFEVNPNNINFGEFPRNQNQFFHVRQPVVHNFAHAPTPFAAPVRVAPVRHNFAHAPVRVAPVGHHFVPSTIVQARANALPVPAPIAKAAPVAAPAPVAVPFPVAAPAPVALPLALPAPTPIAAPIPVVRTVAPTAAPVAITSSFYNAPGQNLDSLNSWSYGFEADNGISQTATGAMKKVGDEEFVVMKGSYQYIGADGLAYQVDWEADENGFRADAPHLPQPVLPPFPEVARAVEAQVRFAASQPPYVEPVY